MRNIRVVPYDPNWPRAFEEEAARIAAVLGEEVLAIHHIGSTSVPGLPAKPIIDLMPVVRSVEALEEYNDAMRALGYEPMGENGIPGRRYFRKGGDEHRTHHVHAFEADHHEVSQHLLFRDYLRAHPETAAEYARLKSELARRFPNDIYGYMDGKDGFIKDTLRAAREWRDARPGSAP